MCSRVSEALEGVRKRKEEKVERCLASGCDFDFNSIYSCARLSAGNHRLQWSVKSLLARANIATYCKWVCQTQPASPWEVVHALTLLAGHFSDILQRGKQHINDVVELLPSIAFLDGNKCQAKDLASDLTCSLALACTRLPIVAIGWAINGGSLLFRFQ